MRTKKIDKITIDQTLFRFYTIYRIDKDGTVTRTDLDKIPEEYDISGGPQATGF